MAGRSKYTEGQRAQVYVTLAANNQNVKRTSRELGVPVSTVRDMKRSFDMDGPPLKEHVDVAAGEFLKAAEEARDFALGTLIIKIPDAKPSELITIIGVLDDKIARARGLADRTVEHRHTLPSPDEIREAMTGVVQGAIEASKQREEDIIDAEIEQPALPPGR